MIDDVDTIDATPTPMPEPHEPPFHVGDVVMVKCQQFSPAMTVEGVFDMPNAPDQFIVASLWFDQDGALQRAQFPAAVLCDEYD
jgi:uncharacterized protein YodC (DUF2158 family)